MQFARLGALALVAAAPALFAQTPSISSWYPYSGAPGAVITLGGSNLGQTTAVYFNGVPGTNLIIQSDWYVKVTILAGLTLTASQRENMNEQAAMDPMPFRLATEDPMKPADVRFLHVLQGGSKQSVGLLPAVSGTPFDGATVGTVAALFRRSIAAPFSTVTFTVPSSTTKTYVTGLTPGAAYTVAKAVNANNIQYTVTIGGASLADVGGVLAF